MGHDSRWQRRHLLGQFTVVMSEAADSWQRHQGGARGPAALAGRFELASQYTASQLDDMLPARCSAEREQLVPTSVARCVRAFLVHDLGCALRQHMPLKAVLECASARKGEPVSAARGISIATLPMMFSECLVPRVGKHGGKEGPRYRQQSQDEGVRDRRLLRVSWHQG